jgi:probable phosphoglycerate mutase
MTGEIVEADFPEFAKAVISALEAIIDENPGKRVAVACHGGVINVWTSHVIGFEPKMFFNPNYTSINPFYGREFRREISRISQRISSFETLNVLERVDG